MSDLTSFVIFVDVPGFQVCDVARLWPLLICVYRFLLITLFSSNVFWPFKICAYRFLLIASSVELARAPTNPPYQTSRHKKFDTSADVPSELLSASNLCLTFERYTLVVDTNLYSVNSEI